MYYSIVQSNLDSINYIDTKVKKLEMQISNGAILEETFVWFGFHWVRCCIHFFCFVHHSCMRLQIDCYINLVYIISSFVSFIISFPRTVQTCLYKPVPGGECCLVRHSCRATENIPHGLCFLFSQTSIIVQALHAFVSSDLWNFCLIYLNIYK